MASKVETREPRETSVVLLYDPKDLTEVQLDRVRAEGSFEVLISAKSLQAILLNSETNSTRVSIQPTRLEFTQELRSPFAERSLESLRAILAVLPELSIRGFGLNYMLSITVQGYKVGGQFIRDRFLAQPTGFEKILGGVPFASATRIIFGQPEEYRDLRLTPPELNSEAVVLQYHYHKEESVRDKDRIYRLIAERYPLEITTLNEIVSQLNA
jgi:hypothetical protein